MYLSGNALHDTNRQPIEFTPERFLNPAQINLICNALSQSGHFTNEYLPGHNRDDLIKYLRKNGSKSLLTSTKIDTILSALNATQTRFAEADPNYRASALCHSIEVIRDILCNWEQQKPTHHNKTIHHTGRHIDDEILIHDVTPHKPVDKISLQINQYQPVVNGDERRLAQHLLQKGFKVSARTLCVHTTATSANDAAHKIFTLNLETVQLSFHRPSTENRQGEFQIFSLNDKTEPPTVRCATPTKAVLTKKGLYMEFPAKHWFGKTTIVKLPVNDEKTFRALYKPHPPAKNTPEALFARLLKSRL